MSSELDNYLNSLNEIGNNELKVKLENFYLFNQPVISFFKGIDGQFRSLLSAHYLDEVFLNKIVDNSSTIIETLTEIKGEIILYDENTMHNSLKSKLSKTIKYIQDSMTFNEVDNFAAIFHTYLSENGRYLKEEAEEKKRIEREKAETTIKKEEAEKRREELRLAEIELKKQEEIRKQKELEEKSKQEEEQLELERIEALKRKEEIRLAEIKLKKQEETRKQKESEERIKQEELRLAEVESKKREKELAEKAKKEKEKLDKEQVKIKNEQLKELKKESETLKQTIKKLLTDNTYEKEDTYCSFLKEDLSISDSDYDAKRAVFSIKTFINDDCLKTKVNIDVAIRKDWGLYFLFNKNISSYKILDEFSTSFQEITSNKNISIESDSYSEEIGYTPDIFEDIVFLENGIYNRNEVKIEFKRTIFLEKEKKTILEFEKYINMFPIYASKSQIVITQLIEHLRKYQQIQLSVNKLAE